MLALALHWRNSSASATESLPIYRPWAKRSRSRQVASVAVVPLEGGAKATPAWVRIEGIYRSVASRTRHLGKAWRRPKRQGLLLRTAGHPCAVHADERNPSCRSACALAG